MTPRELEFLNAVVRFREGHGFSPSYDELCQILGVSSKSGVLRLVKSLQAQRVLTYRSGHPRSIELCDEAVSPTVLRGLSSPVLRRALAHIAGILASRDGGFETKTMLERVGEALLRPGERT